MENGKKHNSNNYTMADFMGEVNKFVTKPMKDNTLTNLRNSSGINESMSFSTLFEDIDDDNSIQGDQSIIKYIAQECLIRILKFPIDDAMKLAAIPAGAIDLLRRTGINTAVKVAGFKVQQDFKGLNGPLYITKYGNIISNGNCPTHCQMMMKMIIDLYVSKNPDLASFIKGQVLSGCIYFWLNTQNNITKLERDLELFHCNFGESAADSSTYAVIPYRCSMGSQTSKLIDFARECADRKHSRTLTVNAIRNIDTVDYDDETFNLTEDGIQKLDIALEEFCKHGKLEVLEFNPDDNYFGYGNYWR